MRDIFHFLKFLECFALVSVLLKPAAGDSCSYWRRIARIQTGSRNDVDVSCHSKSTNPCSGFHCNGYAKYIIRPIYGIKIGVEEADFCLSFQYDGCGVVNISIDVPKKNVMFHHTFNTNISDSVAITNLVYNISRYVELQLFLDVRFQEMSRVLRKMTVVAALRLQFMHRETWPDQRVILRNVPLISHCPGHGLSHDQGMKHPVCRPMRYFTTTTARSTTSTRALSPSAGQRRCDFNSFDNKCNQMTERCDVSHFCDCRTGYVRDGGVCTPAAPPGFTPTQTAQVNATASPIHFSNVSKESMIIVIAGSVVGVLVGIAIIVAILIWVRRRKRSALGHHLVLTTDDEDVDI